MIIQFVTSNVGKFRELQSILKFEIIQVPIHLPEIQGIEVDEVVRFKAEQAYAKVKPLYWSKT